MHSREVFVTSDLPNKVDWPWRLRFLKYFFLLAYIVKMLRGTWLSRDIFSRLFMMITKKNFPSLLFLLHETMNLLLLKKQNVFKRSVLECATSVFDEVWSVEWERWVKNIKWYSGRPKGHAFMHKNVVVLPCCFLFNLCSLTNSKKLETNLISSNKV